MADELTLTVSFSCTKDGATVSEKQSATFTVALSPQSSGVQSIGTSYETVGLGEVTSPGFYYFKNLDATNYMELSSDAGGANPLVKIKGGDFGVFRLTGTTLFAKSNTAACLLKYILLSN